jgi:hypothetical protein
MSFSPNPETVYYRDVVDLLKALQEQAYTEILALEAKSDFTNAKDKERFCYWAGEKEGLNKALFYLWDMGQEREKPHPIRSHHFFLDTL